MQSLCVGLSSRDQSWRGSRWIELPDPDDAVPWMRDGGVSDVAPKLLSLAARPGFDGAETGVQIAALAGSGRIVLRRVVAPLSEALRGGAQAAVARPC
jgi:hypothetical protein